MCKQGMAFLRNTLWFAKGLFEYTNSGYERARRSFAPEDLAVDLSGQAIMITGANSGIGKEAALQLAKRGATVYMVCRSREKGETALAEVKQRAANSNVLNSNVLNSNVQNSSVHLLTLDMSQPREVYRFAKEFLDSGKKLDTLVNNAGCMINTRELVEGSIELNFATNTLGTHILTKTLLPLLARSDRPRVLIVSSGGMLTQRLDAKDLMHEKMRTFDGTAVYAQNKRQQVVMAESYARHHPRIYFASMHPGWADTPGVQTSMPSFRERMKSRLRTPEQGADTLVWMCCYSNLEMQERGAFFQDRSAVRKHLPLARTRNSLEEENELMQRLDGLYDKFSG